MRDDILIIEDNPMCATLLVTLLRSMGLDGRVAFDGEEGVRLAKDDPPRLVLCDIRLPRLDGLGVARELRENPRTRDLKLVAVTACAMPWHRKAAVDAGFDEYVTKPVRAHELRALIQSSLAGADALRHEEQAGGVGYSGSPKRSRICMTSSRMPKNACTTVGSKCVPLPWRMMSSATSTSKAGL